MPLQQEKVNVFFFLCVQYICCIRDAVAKLHSRMFLVYVMVNAGVPNFYFYFFHFLFLIKFKAPPLTLTSAGVALVLRTAAFPLM